MADLVRLDLAAIGGAASDARAIKRVFDESDDSARAAAGAAGHPDLAHAIDRFASTWDDRRQDFAENLGTLAGVLTEIDRAFTEIDRSLAAREEN
ncbi:hypothetical protein [Agromyces sp. PvR057]|uniref:hypothetical protein n=1 Tax=Agromyces sp. PvR057 TaxID=3156403 RepID=UPI000E2377B6